MNKMPQYCIRVVKDVVDVSMMRVGCLIWLPYLPSTAQGTIGTWKLLRHSKTTTIRIYLYDYVAPSLFHTSRVIIFGELNTSNTLIGRVQPLLLLEIAFSPFLIRSLIISHFPAIQVPFMILCFNLKTIHTLAALGTPRSLGPRFWDLVFTS